MIEVRNLTRRYGPLTAVDDVSFRVESGVVAGLLGPNGAGKTTTMRMLAGCLGMTGGSIDIAGHDLATDSEAARAALGYLPEMPPLYVDMTVRDYLDHAARLRRVPGSRRKSAVARALERADLGDVAGRLIGHLSKGYRQRVGIAQALVHEPPVLILDEPTSGLDPSQMGQVRALIDSLRGDHTVLLSTHLLSEVSASCDTVLILVGGRLVADGTEDELRAGAGTGPRLGLRIGGDVAACAEALAGLDGVEDVQIQGGRLSVSLSASSDPRPAVHRVAAAFDLLESVPLDGLEQIFQRALGPRETP